MKKYEVVIFSNRDFFIDFMKVMLHKLMDCTIYCVTTFESFRAQVLLKDIRVVIIDENASDLKIDTVKTFIRQRHLSFFVNNLIYLSLKKKEITKGIYNDSIYRYLEYEFQQQYVEVPKISEPTAKIDYTPNRLFVTIWDQLYDNEYNFSGNLDKDISLILNDFKMTNKFKGEIYLKESIKYIMSNNIRGLCLTKVIYPDVAKMFNTTSQAVERDIRTAITKSYNNIAKQYPKILNHKKPTNMQFLIAVTERLRLFYEKSKLIVKRIDE